MEVVAPTEGLSDLVDHQLAILPQAQVACRLDEPSDIAARVGSPRSPFQGLRAIVGFLREELAGFVWWLLVEQMVEPSEVARVIEKPWNYQLRPHARERP